MEFRSVYKLNPFKIFYPPYSTFIILFIFSITTKAAIDNHHRNFELNVDVPTKTDQLNQSDQTEKSDTNNKNNMSEDASHFENIENILNMPNQLLETNIHKISAGLIPRLRKWAFDNEKELSTRWKALILAARIGGTSLNQDIQLAAKDHDWFMRTAALTASSYVSLPDALKLARRLVNDKALVVRSAAVDFLSRSENERDREVLWKVINDPINRRKGQSLWIRPQALKILVNQPLRKEIPSLVKILKEQENEMRVIALEGLEKVSDFKFGTENESLEDKRQRWLNWWILNGQIKTL